MFRKERFKVFVDRLSPYDSENILDVGGSSEMWLGTGLEHKVTLLNITKPKERDLKKRFKAVQADALNMHMYKKNEFDIVFSNSVIEHVGDIASQERFAEEVKRVGKCYWIQTPNRYFPMEPHFLFPFFQFLPVSAKEKVACRWPFSHYKKFNKPDDAIIRELHQIRLLSFGEFQGLFSDAVIYREKLFGVTKSFVAYKKNE